MNKQERINEIIELMNIPEFEKLISIKVEELKIILDRQIKLYNRLRKEFKGADQQQLLLFENRKVDRTEHTYFFELKRVDDSMSKLGYKWILRKIDPEPGIAVDEIIPMEVIDLLGSRQTNPSKIEFDEFYSARFNKKYDIRSIKYNDSRVFGTIRVMIEGKRGEESHLENKRGTITLDVSQEKIENEKKYTELFRYMEKYPEIRDHIFSYFYMIQKPLVDNAEEMSLASSDE